MYITNAHIVLEDSQIENGVVHITDGRIAGIAQELEIPAGSRIIDANNAWLMPGFIDIHSDAIEKEIEPRPNVEIPVDIALHELDRKLLCAGVTTSYHSFSFANKEIGLRSNSKAEELVRAVARLNKDLLVDTRVHCRYEVTDGEAFERLEYLIEEGVADLVSFMDHTPGQGQFKSVEAYKGYFGKVYHLSSEELQEIIESKKIESESGAALVRVSHLASLCQQYGVPMASHDDDSADKIKAFHEMGVRISEFPIDIPSAKVACDCGMYTIYGAPNLLRGKSQSNNVSTRDVIDAGFAHIICSDYAPSSLLHSLFWLYNNRELSISEVVNMYTLHAAKAVGIDGQTGSIAVGKDADLILVDTSRSTPCIKATITKGCLSTFGLE